MKPKSTHSASSGSLTSDWEERFDKEFKVYRSAYEEYGKVEQYFGVGIKKNIIDFPVSSLKSFLREEIKKARLDSARQVKREVLEETNLKWYRLEIKHNEMAIDGFIYPIEKNTYIRIWAECDSGDIEYLRTSLKIQKELKEKDE
jgi:hypothetical protein